MPCLIFSGLLLADDGADFVKVTGAAEHVILVRNHLGVFVHKRHADVAEVELLGVVAEELAVDAGPDEPAVGIDIDFADAHLGGR